MNTPPLTDFSRLCLHTITSKPWSLDEAVRKYAAAGVKGITVWRQWLQGRDPAEAGRQIREAGLAVVSTCRGGFFPAREAVKRQAAVDENRRILDEATAIGAPHVVLVCGAVPGLPLSEARKQILDGIAACEPHARACRVKMAIEPLHPLYAADRSAVNTLRQANDIRDQLASPMVGVAVDVYHVWWDPDLAVEIARSGRNGSLLAFHVCDWKPVQEDMLNDRGLMGEGCIDLRDIRGMVEASGFKGFIEVEVFSNRYWAQDQDAFLAKIKDAYLQYC